MGRTTHLPITLIITTFKPVSTSLPPSLCVLASAFISITIPLRPNFLPLFDTFLSTTSCTHHNHYTQYTSCHILHLMCHFLLSWILQNIDCKVKARGARVFIITDNPKLALGIDSDPIIIPSNGPLTALIAVLPLQVRQPFKL